MLRVLCCSSPSSEFRTDLIGSEQLRQCPPLDTNLVCILPLFILLMAKQKQRYTNPDFEGAENVGTL